MKDDLTWDEQKALYTVVGAIVIKWGFVDSLLAQTCSIIFEMAGGKHVSDQPPFEMGRRIKFLRRCFGKIAALNRYEELALTIFDRLTPALPQRHFVIHGALSDYERPGRFRFTKLNPKSDKTGYEQHSIDLTADQLLALDDLGQHLVEGLTVLGENLQRQFMLPENP